MTWRNGIIIDDPEHLRRRAAEMRDRADRAVFTETKQGLSRIADDYDLLATRAEQRMGLITVAAPALDQTATPDVAIDLCDVQPGSSESSTQ